MEKQKTALQELIEWLEDSTLKDNQDKDMTIKKAKELLKKDAEQINEAFFQGNKEPSKYNFEVDYYYDKYSN